MGCFSSSNKSIQFKPIVSSKISKENSNKADSKNNKELSIPNIQNVIILKPLQVELSHDASNVEIIADKIVITNAHHQIRVKDDQHQQNSINDNPYTPENGDSDAKAKQQTKQNLVLNCSTDKQAQKPGKNLKNFDQINNSILKLRELSKNSNIFVPSLNKPQFPVESSIDLKLEANPYEQMFPIWVRTEEKISFRVAGGWGVEGCGLTDCLGYSDRPEKPHGYNYCALLGRIGGENKLFSICDEFEYKSSVSGPLFLKMNMGSIYHNLNSQVVIGSLAIKLCNASKTENIEIIDQLLGWNDAKLNTYAYNTTRLFSGDEKQLLILINQLRSDPKQFATIYLHPEEDDEKAVELSASLVKMNPVSSLKPSGILEKLAEETSTCLGSENQVPVGDVGQRAKKYFPSSIKSIKIFENVTVLSRNMPLHFLLHILIDGNGMINGLNNILCEQINYIGISIRQSSKLDWVCVIETSEDYTAE